MLEHHLADVGACFEALLAQPTIRQRLARTAGWDRLDPVTTARLCVLAALHDIGKANMGFQTRIWAEHDLAGKRKPRWAGHTSDLVPVLCGEDTSTNEWFLDMLGWDDFKAWDADVGNTVSALFVAAFSHHGQPLNLHEPRSANPLIWRPFGDLNPQECVRGIGQRVRQWFPAAFGSEAPPLPAAPEFQHMFLGLCTLADWIGSNEDWFEFVDSPKDDYIETARAQAKGAVNSIGLNLAEQRASLGPVPEFQDLFDLPVGASSHPIQEMAAMKTALDEPLVIIESETGSGKTEAALWRFARMYQAELVDGIYFALPTRSAASQLHRRVTKFIANLFAGPDRPEPVLAAPGYIRAGDFTGQHLSRYEVWWEDDPGGAERTKRWAAEDAKRFLAAQIAVGTVDQAMLGTLKVKHAHLRAACLARNLLVVDEVHASDTYMRAIIEDLLDANLGAGGYALLMSATLGAGARHSLLHRRRSRNAPPLPTPKEAEDTHYPAIITGGAQGEIVSHVLASGSSKQVTVRAKPAMADFVNVAMEAVDAARQGAKVLVIRNTVSFAIETQQALQAAVAADDRDLLFNCRGVPTMHHGRFAAEDRRLLDTAVAEQFGRVRPENPTAEGQTAGRVVVGTQTLEQSLDLDADLLITDLCPMDVLLQRIGRLHRHDRSGGRPVGFGSPTCVVLMPGEGNLTPFLSRQPNRNGLGPHGFVYEDLRILEATRRLIQQFSESGDPWLIPEMNRMLVERATHPDILAELVEELGDNWKVHGLDVTGARIAEGLTARNAVIRRDLSFLERDVVFGSDEERIRTRLGDEGIKVIFQPQPTSPFDPALPIPQITIPDHLCRGLRLKDPISTTPADEGFEFTIEGATFHYDRWGLRRG